MTTIHVVRGLYLLISVTVAVSAACRGVRSSYRDGLASTVLAAYAASTAAAQTYAFQKPLTVGTAYVGIGVVAGACWLITLAIDTKRRSS